MKQRYDFLTTQFQVVCAQQIAYIGLKKKLSVDLHIHIPIEHDTQISIKCRIQMSMFVFFSLLYIQCKSSLLFSVKIL